MLSTPSAFSIFADDADGVVLMLFELLADLKHITRPPGEGSGDEIRLHLAGKGDVGLVSLAHKGHGEGGTRDVDPFVGGYGSSVEHRADDIRVGGLLHDKVDQAVVDEDVAAFIHVSGQSRKADRSPLRRSFGRDSGQGEGVSRLERHFFREGAQPDFRPFGVDKDRNGQAQLLPQCPDPVDTARWASWS